LSVAAHSACLCNGSFDLAIIENKIDFQEEVIIQADNEMTADFVSVESIQSSGFQFSLLLNNIIMINNRKRKAKIILKRIDLRVRLPDNSKIAA